MPTPSRNIQAVVWGGLGLVVLGVVGVFFLAPPAKPLPVYGSVPGFSLSNQDGQIVTDANWRGHVTVVDLIFSRCAGQCLLMSATMKQLQDALPSSPVVALVSLTCDPDYDTPAILKKYGGKFGARDGVWSFLTGPKKTLHEVAVGGLKLVAQEKAAADQETSADLFLHSTKLVLIDQQGRIRAYFDGETSQCIPAVLAAIRQLGREP